MVGKIWQVIGGIVAVGTGILAVGLIAVVTTGLIKRIAANLGGLLGSALEWLAGMILDSLREIKEIQRLGYEVVPVDPSTGMRPGVLNYNTGLHTNPDTAETLSLTIRREVEPVRAQVEAIRALLIAARGTHHVESIIEQQPALMAGTGLPRLVTMPQLMAGQTPTLDNVPIGVTMTETGELDTVRMSLDDMLHLLGVGSTGTGKTTWVTSFLYFLAQCRNDDFEVMAIDIHGSGFNLLTGWDRMRYPVAKTADDADQILREISAEMKRRKDLYTQVPIADSLDTYHQNKPDGFPDLPRWVLFIDEGNTLLDETSVERDLRHVLQGARQYGIFIYMLMQVALARILKSDSRSLFRTRLCFHTELQLVKPTLGLTPEGKIEPVPGRCWAVCRNSDKPIQLQTPLTSRRELLDQICRHQGGAQRELPKSEVQTFKEQVAEALEQVGGDLKHGNKSKICRLLDLQPRGNDWDKVIEALRDLGVKGA